MPNVADKPKLMTAEQFRICETLPDFKKIGIGKISP